jgi:hypothetical protein
MVEAPKVCPATPGCERLPSGQPERIALRINATDRSPFKSRSCARSAALTGAGHRLEVRPNKKAHVLLRRGPFENGL